MDTAHLPANPPEPLPAIDQPDLSKTRPRAVALDLVLYLFFWPAISSVLAACGVEQADDWAFFIIAPLLYWVGLVALGVTPGSWLLDIRIVDNRGQAPGLWRAFRRSLFPGTAMVLVASSAGLLDPRLDALYEGHPIIEGTLFWGGALLLTLSFWVYCRKLDTNKMSTMWHDTIAGTRVVPYRSKRKAAFVVQAGTFKTRVLRW